MRNSLQKNSLHSISQVIEKHLQLLTHDTSMSMMTFVSNVREHYENTHLLHSRTIEWSQVSDTVKRMARDAEKFKRWLESDTNHQLPIDLYESIIAAFPPDRRFRLQVELLARQGFIPVQKPSVGISDELATLGSIAKKTGESMIAISKLLEDGAIDGRDRHIAPEALAQIDEAVAVFLGMRALINANVFGKKDVDE